MKYDTVEMNSGRIYCPSTDEIILSMDEPNGIMENAKALIAAWNTVTIDQPIFNNNEIRIAWEKYLHKFPEEDREDDVYDKICDFLEGYEAPAWRVYEIQTTGWASGPVMNTDWFVVLVDTVIE